MSEDKIFLQGIAQGNTPVLRQVYAKYFDSIAKFTLQNKGSLEDAKDLFQDALMIMYEKLQDADFELQHGLHTYLYSICRNLWLKKLRKKSDKWGPLSENQELIAEDTFEKEILWRQKEKLYRQKFAQLDANCQKLIQLFLAGNSMENIARTLQLSSAAYAKKRKCCS